MSESASVFGVCSAAECATLILVTWVGGYGVKNVILILHFTSGTRVFLIAARYGLQRLDKGREVSWES